VSGGGGTAGGGGAGAGGEVKSPLAGSILSVAVNPGDTVSAGDTLLVLEAMKMESPVAAPQAGTIAEVLVSKGDAVQAQQTLLRFA
jgi:biotin carboxyl carrier protein